MIRSTLLGMLVTGGLVALLMSEPVTQQEPRPGPSATVPSAIDLLGDTWEIGAPDAIATPPASEVARPTDDARPMPRPIPEATVAAVDIASEVTATEVSRQPAIRPQRRADDLAALQRQVTPDASQVATAITPAVAQPALPVRWVVRRPGTGEVVAELPLDAALSLLGSSLSSR